MTSLVFKRQKRSVINEIDPFSKRYISLIEIISIKKNMIFWEDISLTLYNDIKISIFSQGQIRPKTHQRLWSPSPVMMTSP